MTNIEKKRQLIQELIDVDKWKETLARFIDVLKINIFLVDFEGQVILPPVKDRYGWSFYEKNCLGFDIGQGKANMLDKFEKNGDYWQHDCDGGFQSFAISVNAEYGETIAYLIMGPVNLSKKEDYSFYGEVAKRLGVEVDGLIDMVNEVRIVSHLTMKSILDLLATLAKDIIELKLEKKRLSKVTNDKESFARSLPISEEARDIYATIHLDELLISLLDLALKMTNAECGSIMVLDDKREELTIKVSRGIDEERVQRSRVKLGEGLAGLAAQENSLFVIHGTQGENRIQHLLNRSDIKHSIIMPLSGKRKVLGVLNLHTKKEGNEIEGSIDNLQYLSRLISAAFQSI
ncbi:MAG: GAF domain-containing protein [Candidatus Omnitrophota bacterium]